MILRAPVDATATTRRLGIRFSDLFLDAATNVARQPARTVLTALGTAVGVGAAISTVGVAGSAAASVSSTFDALRATQVTFAATSPDEGERPPITLASEQTVTQLNGVRSAGVMWDEAGGDNLSVAPVPLAVDPTGLRTISAPVTVATPAALRTMGLRLLAGRMYDVGDVHRQESVGIIGQSAATQLGIDSVGAAPAVFVDGVPITVIGIAGSSQTENKALLGVLIPPTLSKDFAGAANRRLIVRTEPGAAQLIGRQAPALIAPSEPKAILANVPPDPRTLRQHVEGSLRSLLLVLAALSLLIGVVAIATTTLMSVVQRTSEIGLRRALGARPAHIALLLLIEAALIGGVGGIFGTSIGVLVTGIASAVHGWVAVLDPRLIAVAPLAGALTGMLAGAYPARHAVGIEPVAALQR